MKKFGPISVGADPEVFFIEQRTNKPRSAEGLLGGDKSNPLQMEGLAEGFMIQEDNVTAEFNIPPAFTGEEFSKNIFLGLKYIGKIAKENSLKIAIVPELDFPEEQLATKHCQTLGCNPDFNAWLEKENPAPKAPQFMRTAAGHVHIGWKNPSWDQVLLVAKAFDVFLTCPSLLVTSPSRRRELYGRAGACRPKPYGVECRSLDNFWLSKKQFIRNVFRNVHVMIKTIEQQSELVEEQLHDYAAMIINTINTHNVRSATFLCEKFQVPLL